MSAKTQRKTLPVTLMKRSPAVIPESPYTENELRTAKQAGFLRRIEGLGLLLQHYDIKPEADGSHWLLLCWLRLLERKPRSGGRGDSVDHPPRAHDDIANAACGALWQASISKLFRGGGRRSRPEYSLM